MIQDRIKTLPDHELFLLYQKTKQEDVRNEIIDRHIRMAQMVARRYSGRGIEYDDLFQVASLGLLFAAQRYDPAKGVKFTTFAIPTISGEIKRYFRDKGNFIRVPRKLYEIFQKAHKIGLANRPDGEPVDEAVATISMVSLDAGLSDDNAQLHLEHILGSDDEAFLLVEDRDFIDRCLARLTKQERDFVQMRYYDENTQKQIANKLGVSQMYVSRLERKVLGKLKDMYFKTVA